VLSALQTHANCKRFHEYLAGSYFDGTVSGAFDYGMEVMMDHIAAWRRRDLNEACRIWESGLSDLQEYVRTPRLHVRYKAAAWLRGTIPFPFYETSRAKAEEGRIIDASEALDYGRNGCCP
jgi:4-hydroxy-tetrahydrodipicolinate synthase